MLFAGLQITSEPIFVSKVIIDLKILLPLQG